MAKYCIKCGNKLEEEDSFCSSCGHVQYGANTESKSRLGAGLLGIFLGWLGIHNFYLGYTNKAIAQLLLGTIGWIFFGMGAVASSIWGFIEGIMILSGNISEDANGNPLKD